MQFRPEDTTPSATPVEPTHSPQPYSTRKLRQPTAAVRTSTSRSRAVRLTNPSTHKALRVKLRVSSCWSAFSGSVHRARHPRLAQTDPSLKAVSGDHVFVLSRTGPTPQAVSSEPVCRSHWSASQSYVLYSYRNIELILRKVSPRLQEKWASEVWELPELLPLVDLSDFLSKAGMIE